MFTQCENITWLFLYLISGVNHATNWFEMPTETNWGAQHCVAAYYLQFQTYLKVLTSHSVHKQKEAKLCSREHSEEICLLLHVISFPQWKSVKILNVHAKDIVERLRGQVALQREPRQTVTSRVNNQGQIKLLVWLSKILFAFKKSKWQRALLRVTSFMLPTFDYSVK